MTLHSLPVFVRLQGRAVILVGDGEAADAKRRLLERAGAVVVGEDGLSYAPPNPPFVSSEVETRATTDALEGRPSTALGTNGDGGMASQILAPSPVPAEPFDCAQESLVEARPEPSSGESEAAAGRPSTSSGRTEGGKASLPPHAVRAELVEALPFSSEESTALRQARGEREWSTPRLAIVVDDDAAVARLKARGILVNAVDRPDLCDFTLPAIVDRDPVLVAIGTGGASAGLAAALRQRLEALIPVSIGALARTLFAARAALRERWPEADARRRALASGMAAGGALDPLGTDHDVDAWFAAAGGGARDAMLVRIALRSPDPDDLTLREARALAQADHVTHAANVPGAILDRARADAARIACDAPPVDAPGLTVDVRFA